MTTDCAYLSALMEKYEFIESIYITDNNGGIIISSNNKQENLSEMKLKVKEYLSYNLLVSMDQIKKTQKWNTKNITTFFDNHVLYQRQLCKNVQCHIICNQDNYSHEIVNEISDELVQKFEPIQNKFE